MSKKIKKKAVYPARTPVKIKTAPSSRKIKIDYHLIGLVIVILAVSLIRLRLLQVPLERDEGEYAYFGKLIMDGIAPYKQAYNMKLPGTYFMYAFIMEIFGKSTLGIHLGLLFLNATTIVFFYLGFRKIFNASVALFAACVYGILSVSYTVFGFAAHATHFVNFFVSVGFFFLAKFYERKKPLTALWVGLMFGLSFLMKQQAVFFIVFGGIAVILADVFERPLKLKAIFLKGAVYSAGAVTPYVLTILILKAAGAFENFWFWTIQYASKYAAGVSFKDGMTYFGYSFKPMWHEFAFVWLLFFAGLIFTFLSKYSWKQKIVAITFAGFSFLTVCPGFYFREHYFVCFLPAIGLIAAITMDYISTFLSRSVGVKSLSFLPFVVIGIVFISIISKNKDYYLNAEPNEISRMIYGNNPFVESPEIANYIKENTTPTDKIAVLGSEPQILFYANRNSATGYIYTYGLMEIHDYNKKMQEEMIREIEKNKPKFIVFCNISTSWLSRPQSPTLIFDWFTKYSDQYYTLTGVVDLLAGQTIYKWNDEVLNYKTQGKENIFVFKRK
jgi:4-amino-4-deoxy-L-arabinose transferase-like glycosyltransferase